MKNVPLSDDNVKKRIDDMSSDIIGTLITKLKMSQKFALQIDESITIKNRALYVSLTRTP